MAAHAGEWLNLVLRWFHLIAAIGWIGSSFYFMWLDAALTAPDPPRVDVKGEVWMVHSGGFYRVEKRLIGPGRLPSVLHWFKWEAALTWVSGFFLLAVVYYHGGGIYLVDASVSSISVRAATALGIGVLVAGWAAYDVLWNTLGRKAPGAAAGVSLSALVGVAWGLSHLLSGRAAYIHVGAMLGTIMVANVWMRILPAQRQMIRATDEGREPDLSLGARAKQRSVHNNYMTLPVVFIMLSNHFPSTYAHPWRWAVLVALMLAGAGVRHFLNAKGRAGVVALVGAAVVALALFVVTAPPGLFGGAGAHDGTDGSGGGGGDGAGAGAVSPGSGTGAAAAAPGKSIDAAAVGSIHGVVHLDGVPPAPAELTLPSGCAAGHAGPVYGEAVVAHDGKLANAFVWLGKGAEAWAAPPAPKAPIVVDQHGCTYAPHVLGAQVGQPVTFLNSDPLLHNVDVASTHRAPYNLSMPAPGMKLTRTFDQTELMVRVKCDVHPWMSAWIGVLPHPWFAVSDADGAFSIAGVPPGDYVLEAWHETYGRLSVPVTVAAKGAAEAGFTFKVP
jgi:uncharacterized membrane protein/plastocyanin